MGNIKLHPNPHFDSLLWFSLSCLSSMSFLMVVKLHLLQLKRALKYKRVNKHAMCIYKMLSLNFLESLTSLPERVVTHSIDLALRLQCVSKTSDLGLKLGTSTSLSIDSTLPSVVSTLLCDLLCLNLNLS